MPALYPYTYSSEGVGPWWGIRVDKATYEEMIRQMHGTRCFVYLTNERGDTLAIAVEGPHNEDPYVVFAPEWAIARLGILDGDTIIIDHIEESLPKCTSVKMRPLTTATVEGPMFLEGLTEALNQLGIVQEGLLSAIVDQSMPELHEFIVDDLVPAKVCLADGELTVDLETAIDYIEPEPVYEPITRPDTPIPEEVFGPMVPISSNTVIMPTPTPTPSSPTKFVPFSGRGRRLDGKN